MLSGFVYVNASFPFDLLKIKMMAKLGQPNLSYRTEMAIIYQREGLYGFTRGYSAQCIRDVGTFCNFGIFDFLKRELGVDKSDCCGVVAKKFLAGGLSAVCSFTMFFPFDTCKTKLQSTEGERLHCFQIMSKLVRENGVSSLYRGVHLQMVKAFFTGALTLNSLDAIRQQLKKAS